MKIEKWDNKNGPLTLENATTLLKKQGYKVHCYEYQPGTVFPNHTHREHKKDMVISGTFLMRAEGQEFILKAGDMLEVPAGTVHYAEVLGNEPVVSLDAIRV